jgi:hypothetical protein
LWFSQRDPIFRDRDSTIIISSTYMSSALLYLFYIICKLKQQLFCCSTVHFWCIRIYLVFFSFYIHPVPTPLPYIFLISWIWINRWRFSLPIFTSILFQSGVADYFSSLHWTRNIGCALDRRPFFTLKVLCWAWPECSQ